MRYDQHVTLRNGKPCLLRSARAEDAQTVIDQFVRTHGETDFLLSYPDEASFTPEQESEFLARKEADPRELELCAVVDGRIVGTAGLESLGRFDKVRHRAEFGISVLRAYWGMGIGRVLTEACIACAREAGYAQLELDAVADNAAALALYRSLGFIEYGRNPRGFRSRSGRWQELVLMRLEL